MVRVMCQGGLLSLSSVHLTSYVVLTGHPYTCHSGTHKLDLFVTGDNEGNVDSAIKPNSSKSSAMNIHAHTHAA